MDKTAVFIDGAYLDKVLSREFAQSRIDYYKLAQWLCPDSPLFRCYYYNCLPFISEPPLAGEPDRFIRKQRFFNTLANLPQFEVRLGQLEYRGNKDDGSPIFVQKRVDILMGIDLIMLAAKHSISHASVFTGDSDFLPAILMAKNEGVFTTLGHGTANPPHDDLWQSVDKRMILTNSVVQAIAR